MPYTKVRLSENRINWDSREKFTKFKAEICLLLTAIALFAVSAFLYSYSSTLAEGFTAAASTLEYPYQSYAISFVGFGSLLMLTASLSYLKRSKTVCVNIRAVELSEELH